MAVSLTRFSWWYLGRKEKKPVSNDSCSDLGLGLIEQHTTAKNSKRFSSVKVKKVKSRRKWQSREERRVEKEYDVVVVPSDGGVCLSGSESDDSDWSIGWLEPHAPDFQSDSEADNSFAVLVPCYRNNCQVLKEEEEEEADHPRNHFLTAVSNLSNESSAEGNKYMEDWLSSLQNL